jgi:hypothetical protein
MQTMANDGSNDFDRAEIERETGGDTEKNRKSFLIHALIGNNTCTRTSTNNGQINVQLITTRSRDFYLFQDYGMYFSSR